MNIVEKIIKLVGSQSDLAKTQKVTQQTVFLWKKSGRIPSKRVLSIEKLIKNQYTRYQIRPDIYGKSPQ